MSDIQRIDPGPRMSEASVLGDRIYCSGMIPEDTSQDVTGQVKQALAEIDSLLAKGGSDKTRILTATVWLADTASMLLPVSNLTNLLALHRLHALGVGVGGYVRLTWLPALVSVLVTVAVLAVMFRRDLRTPNG